MADEIIYNDPTTYCLRFNTEDVAEAKQLFIAMMLANGFDVSAMVDGIDLTLDNGIINHWVGQVPVRNSEGIPILDEDGNINYVPGQHVNLWRVLQDITLSDCDRMNPAKPYNQPA